MWKVIIVILILFLFLYTIKKEKIYLIAFTRNLHCSNEYEIDKNKIVWNCNGIFNNGVRISSINYNPKFSLFISELKPSSNRPNEMLSAAGNSLSPEATVKQIKLKFKKCLKEIFKEVNYKDKYFDNDRTISTVDNDFGFSYDCALTDNLLDSSLVLYKNKLLHLQLNNLQPSDVSRFVKIKNYNKMFKIKLPDIVDYNLGQVNLVSKMGFKKSLVRDNYGFFTGLNFNNLKKCEIIDINDNKVVLYNIEPNYVYYLPF